MKIKNLTPHNIHIICPNGGKMNIPPSGPPARCTQNSIFFGDFDVEGAMISFTHTTYGDVIDLPEPEDNTVIVVSAMVANHPDLQSRADLAYPGILVRDEEGRIIGCESLNTNRGLAFRLNPQWAG